MAEAAHGGCFHCGDSLPATPERVHIDGIEQLACCIGCAAAATFIRDAGLGDYYRIRSEAAAAPASADFSSWDRDDVLREHSRVIDSDREITVVSDDMRCAACAWLIDRALQREPGLREVQANAVSGRIRLRWSPALQPLSQLLQRIASLGYRVYLAPDAEREQARLRERRSLVMRLGIAALGSMQAMMLAEALYLDLDNTMQVPTRDFFRWITLLVSTPVVFYSGWPFIEGMLRDLRLRRAGMDTLIASSVLLAWAASLIETVRGGPHVWFDAAVMFVFFLLAARSLEGFARQRANAVVERLARARPALATRIDADGQAQDVPLAALQPGDVVRVAAGASVPADGCLLEDGEFDEALLSGESRPVPHAAGDSVLAGTLCLGMPVRLRIERTGSDTRLSQLVHAVEVAQAERPALAQWADRIAGKLVLALLAAAALTYLLWLQHDPSRAFEVALAVLVVSCPCALSLAIPTALVTAHGSLARLGMLSLRPEGLAQLARIDTVVLDKTGTLSAGIATLQRSDMFNGCTPAWACAAAAALERGIQHPLAAAFHPHASDALHAEQGRLTPGHGVSAVIDGRLYRLGRAGFAVGGCDDTDDRGVWLGDAEQRPLARFELADRLRPGAPAAIGALRALGLDLCIASGDAAEAVADCARNLGISERHARLLPEDKLALLRRKQAAGHVVAMLGDGINDGPVLAGADVSIALGSGAALAHRAADWVLIGDDLGRLAQAIALARRSRRIIRQNLGWAVLYNLLALPFAMAGWVPPWLAALGMTASSLLVTLNALRLSRVPTPDPRSEPTSQAAAALSRLQAEA